jgi:calcineurin-like phosphoesterase family protein
MEPRIFVISDTHFNHKSMITKKWRDFKSVEQMNEHIIYQWNQTVTNEDIVFILGDLCIGKKTETIKEIMPILNGRHIIISGNHDKGLTNPRIQSIVINYKGLDVELVHDPKNASGKYKYVIHGHLHQHNREFTKNPKLRYYNCNLELHKYKPQLISQAIGEMKSKPKGL